MNILIFFEIVILTAIFFIGLNSYMNTDEVLGLRIMVCVFGILIFKYFDLKN